MAIKVVKEPAPKPGTLGRVELYALAIGQVIGAGVITLREYEKISVNKILL